MPGPGDDSPVKVREEIVLQKYNGNPPGPGRSKAPAEVVKIFDDRVTYHEKAGQVIFDRDKGIDNRPDNDKGKPYHPYPNNPAVGGGS